MYKYLLPLFFLCLTASARDKHDGHDRPHYRPHRHNHWNDRYIVRAYFVPGYWESRTEVVLVEPARYEEQWVDPEYKDIVGADGKTVKIKVREGYYRQVYVPPRYETRTLQYWIPGSWLTFRF